MAQKPLDLNDPAQRASALEREKHVQRIRDEAKRAIRTERLATHPIPAFSTLRDRLARPRPKIVWRITNLQRMGHRVILAAQFKSGKTTMIINLIRALLDDMPFLDTYDVSPVKNLALLDFEMADDEPNQLDDWYRAASIQHDDRLTIIPLRGRAASFNILDDTIRADWAARLRGFDYLAIDCLRPILDALGIDENHEAGLFLGPLDALMQEAGIRECALVHHMGHANERSRGDSRILDWPDVTWTLVRETEDPASARFFKAFGRGVDVPETKLEYNLDTHRLAIEGSGSRADAKVQAALDAICRVLTDAPLSGREIEKLVTTDEEHTQKVVRRALSSGTKISVLRKERNTGRGGGWLYSVVTMGHSFATMQGVTPRGAQASGAGAARLSETLNQMIAERAANPDPEPPRPDPERFDPAAEQRHAGWVRRQAMKAKGAPHAPQSAPTRAKGEVR